MSCFPSTWLEVPSRNPQRIPSFLHSFINLSRDLNDRDRQAGKMFFFFVGGIEQQAGRALKEAAGRCLRCGGTADLVECEKVLKLFFVPVWRWPGRVPAFRCRDCSFLFPQSLPIDGDAPDSAIAGVDRRSTASLPRDIRCHSCTRPVDPQFRFCPYCGFAL